MTAKEIAKKNLDKDTGGYIFSPKKLQEFIDQVCKEQKEKCIKHYGDRYVIDEDWFMITPQPEVLP